MAFGHADCDLIYDRYICPVLRKLNVYPIRVAQRRHSADRPGRRRCAGLSRETTGNCQRTAENDKG